MGVVYAVIHVQNSDALCLNSQPGIDLTVQPTNEPNSVNVDPFFRIHFTCRKALRSADFDHPFVLRAVEQDGDSSPKSLRHAAKVRRRKVIGMLVAKPDVRHTSK